MSARDQAVAARAAMPALMRAGTQGRVAALHRMADALLEREAEILAANVLDVADAAAAVAAGTLSAALAARLDLSRSKLAVLADGIRAIANMDEPIGRKLRHTEVASGMDLRLETTPIGVLLIIFESRPDALPQLAALALRAGDALVLKGGAEAARSNAILHQVLCDALAPDVPRDVLQLVRTREEVSELLALDDVIDLVIPRGSNALVRAIQSNTRIPVLGHADGVCHVFVDVDADLEMARRIVTDAKKDYPAACNAMETLLVHRALVSAGHLPSLLAALDGVTLFAHPEQTVELGLPAAPSLHHEYGDLAATVAIVDDVDAAIAHIRRWGSAHTDAIVTANRGTADRFIADVDSACVFWNASTRFADGYRFGLGGEVGVSTARLHARGPVGVDGLLTSRWVLEGTGQTVTMTRTGDVAYTHRPLA
jgi:delta-1-pyrroline-5-carboxylate synthetase